MSTYDKSSIQIKLKIKLSIIHTIITTADYNKEFVCRSPWREW